MNISFSLKRTTNEGAKEKNAKEEALEDINPREFPIYEDRIVAFIDILGFRSIVQKSSKHHDSEKFYIPQYREEDLPDAIFSALDTRQHAWYEAFLFELEIQKDQAPTLDLRITSFSDCIALSCPKKEIDFCYLISCILYLVSILLRATCTGMDSC